MRTGSSSPPATLFALLGACLVAGAVHAEEPPPAPCEARPGEVVASVFTELRGLHRRALPGPDGTMLRDRQVSALVMRHIAASRFTAEVLRASWARADEAYRARWPLALGALLHQRLLRALKDPLRYQLTVGEVTVDAGCGDATVHLTLTERRRKRVVQLALRMERREGPWSVWDVRSPEVSLVRTWRSRFARAAKLQGSLEGLDGEPGELGRRLDVAWPPLRPRETKGAEPPSPDPIPEAPPRKRASPP